MLLISCEISLNLIWSSACASANSTREEKFAITDTKPYIPVVTLSTKDNAKLLGQ